MITRRGALLFALMVVLGMPVFFAGGAWAGTQFLNDGAVQNNYGGFDLPLQGSCPAGALNSYSGIDTRPECVALRLNIAPASCIAPNYSNTTGGVCNDLVNTTQSSCNAAPDRLWNPGTGICAIVMMDDDRNDVTCAKHRGTWVTTATCTGSWIMPAGSSYNPPLLGTGTGPGDQCLRCHNTRTQYNNPRVRDTEDTMFMGHKNMSRKVTPTKPWGGPGFQCVGVFGTAEEQCYDNGGNWVPIAPYPGTDTGQDFDWVNGLVNIDTTGGTNWKTLFWIYGDWLSALPRSIYSADPNTAPTPDTPGISYSCARCHTTGWSSDATVNYGVGGPGTSTREPEKSFPGITWNGVADAVTGQVNLAGGVSGDTNKMSSWDNFGIVCSRCHSSAVDRTSTATSGFSAPTGMSSHHSDLTAPDVSTSGDKGYCTDSRFTTEAVCNSNGGAWLTACSKPGFCSNSLTTNSGECVAGGGTWTKFNDQASCLTNSGTWYGTGCVGDATLTTQATCQGAGKTWFGAGCSNAIYTTQTTCESNSAVWSDSRCTVPGVCNNPAYTNAVACNANGAQWRVTTDVIRCEDAGGRWTGSKTNRGQLITALCMNCHRQETGGKPYDSGSNPAGLLKVGVNHGTLAFLSHPHANQYLNSPHAKYTGTFAQVATATFGNGYGSEFQNSSEAAKTGNGCTGCHEVHTSTVTGEKPFREECTECHSNSADAATTPQIDLSKINHLGGVGTPLEEIVSNPSEACISCHMPGGLHLWRINADGNYSTFPATAMTSTVNANTAAEGTYTNAVWVDVDFACGQCHGGGIAQKSTTGSMALASATLTVPSSTGFTVGQRILVQGAGSLYYDNDGVSKLNNDLETYIKAIPTATTLTLVGPASKAVNNVAVVQNPTKNGAPYHTKASLATVAKGMHASAGITYPVTFSATVGNPNTLQVNVDAVVDCGGSPCPTFTYDWNWGDNTTHGTTDPATHTYASGGSKSIALVVNLNGKQVGTYTRNVTVTNPDLAPTVAGTCTWTGNTWVMQVVDASTDDGPDADTVPPDGNSTLKISVDWGDGTTKSSGNRGTTFNHTYAKIGTFTVTRKATDSKLQASSLTCDPVKATPAYFSISATVKNKLATLGIGSAAVTVRKGTTIVKTVYTASNGTFSVGSLLPGTYSFTVVKAGYTFPAPGTAGNPNVIVGPNGSAGVAGVIKATAP